MPHSEIANQIEQLLWNKFFNTIFSLESDQMTDLWANDILNFTLYVTISNSIENWKTFVKEIFWFDDYSESETELNFHFLCHILKWNPKLCNFCKISCCIRYLVWKLSFCFPYLSCSFSLYLGLSLSTFINLCLSQSISIHPGPSWSISEYLCLFRSIFGYLGIFLTISSYLYGYLWLSQAILTISGYIWLSQHQDSG